MSLDLQGVDVSHQELPLTLAELHRSLRVGSRVSCSFIDGPQGVVVSDEVLVDVFTGAGFGAVELSGDRPRFVDAVRERTLPDTVSAGMRILVCGLNPSVRAADAGVGFFTPGNRFWPAAIAAGLATVDRDPWHAVREHGMGMTDLVKRATPRADVLTRAEYAAGLERVERLGARLQPGVVCFVGLAGWRSAVDRKAPAGLQERRLGGRPVYVMPSTSGLNAHSRLADLTDHLRTALAYSTN